VRDDRDTRACDEEEAGADGRAGGGRRAGPAGPGAGLSLTGPDGLLKQLTKVVIEAALDQELTEHLGHERNTPAGNEAGNIRNGRPALGRGLRSGLHRRHRGEGPRGAGISSRATCATVWEVSTTILAALP
jgi:hypothetical protein